MQLGFGVRFNDLYEREGLLRVDAAFLRFLGEADTALRDRLTAGRSNSQKGRDESDLLVALAPHVEDFLARLFGIEAEACALAERHNELAPLYSVKRLFVQRRALHKVKPEDVRPDGFSFTTELDFARQVTAWLKDEAKHRNELETAARYAAWATTTPEGKAKHRGGVLFKAPRKLDYMKLIPHTEPRHREGFKLTDSGTDLAGALDEANYCIWCHEQGKDSCSKGLREKPPAEGFRKTVFGVPLAGCPLEEKISEFHMVKARGEPLAALGIVAVDNPMAAATGHRICNDCMKSCIFQKQDPVDIPQAETRTLKDVLELPWGFEIYSLLTRWNPLDFERPLPRKPSGYKVLVAGLGPAGFTLAHHLMNDGHTVVGIDGLKIEPLPPEISGVTALGERVLFRPIRDITEIYESLDERTMAGFGGVAEYGITVRWDKNFLKIVRLLLERRRQFSMFGGVRFGGTLTMDRAFELGFDHVALCMGAGKPTVIPMKNRLARGVRQASDFLMALQLTGAAKTDSVANLQIRMPIVVIGGGLTAIDTATESLAYYAVQVEKFLNRFEQLVDEHGEEFVRGQMTAEERQTADEFCRHAMAIRAERAAATRERRKADIIGLLNSWGGSTIVYRRRLIDSPSYTLNHEEVAKALEEGVRFAECLSPEEVELDEFGHASALRLARYAIDPEADTLRATGEHVTLPARSILVAAGTQPNTMLAREDAENFALDGKHFRALDEEGNPVRPEHVAKPSEPRVLVSLRPDGKGASFFGDLHPSWSGNVVKAMASAKLGCPIVSRVLHRVPPSPAAGLLNTLNQELRAVVHDVVRLTPNIVEVIVKAPMAARAFQPGQFYRLQNFETLAARVNGTTLAMEGIALTGASADRENGLLSTIVLEMGGSSDLCALLRPGEPVILMGPTGSPTDTPASETVLLAGGGLGNAVLFSIGQTLRAKGSRVVYFAGYKKVIDRYKADEIERAADAVVWCCDEPPGFTPRRVQDYSFVGNIVRAMVAYAQGELGDPVIPLQSVQRVIAIGSDGMMNAVATARHTVLKPYLAAGHHAIGSINSPMQCMMKEICAQCLMVFGTHTIKAALR